MRKKLLQNALKGKLKLVVAFPLDTPDLRKPKAPREVVADCGHIVVTGREQRELADSFPLCCITCAFLAGVTVDRIQGLDEIDFRMSNKIKTALKEARQG